MRALRLAIVGERPLPLPVRASVLGGLYLVQGLVYGTGGLVLVPQLAAAGVELEHQAGILALAGVPWVLKLAWAPLVDTRAGRRFGAGRIAAVAMATIAAAFAAIACVPEPAGAVLPIALAWLAINAALSLQDVAADALAFDLIAVHERGRVLAVMLGAQHVGAEALAGAWIGAVAASRGLGSALVVLALVVLALASLALAAPRSSPRPRGPLGAAAAALLRDRAALAALGICAVVYAADVATSAATGELLVGRLGWSPEEIAARVPMPLLVGSIAGYAIAAVLVDRLGHLRIARASTVLLGGCWLAFALAEPAWTSVGFVQGFIVVQAIATAWLYASVQTLVMDVVHPELRATQLAVLTAVLNLPRVWAPLLAAALVPAIGLTGLFVACGLWQCAVAWPLSAMGRRPRDAC